jgi:hypothetical protein
MHESDSQWYELLEKMCRTKYVYIKTRNQRGMSQ